MNHGVCVCVEAVFLTAKQLMSFWIKKQQATDFPGSDSLHQTIRNDLRHHYPVSIILFSSY